MYSYTEENYIKAIYKLSDGGKEVVSTNALADLLQTKAASVSDMLRKLSTKEIIHYVKYRGVSLTPAGNNYALHIIRKHRLWEVFLVTKLHFSWDEVHEVAEELEHIKSELLIKRLDEFLEYPQFDPHGDPIPTEKGEMQKVKQVLISELNPETCGVVVGVRDTQPIFLQYLDKIGIFLGASIKVLDKSVYDNSLEIKIEDKKELHISQEVSKNIFVTI